LVETAGQQLPVGEVPFCDSRSTKCCGVTDPSRLGSIDSGTVGRSLAR
jgi:hypothetical protein